MLITNITNISFKIPDELEAEEHFRLNNNLQDWKKVETSLYIIYQRVQYNIVTYKEK